MHCSCPSKLWWPQTRCWHHLICRDARCTVVRFSIFIFSSFFSAVVFGLCDDRTGLERLKSFTQCLLQNQFQCEHFTFYLFMDTMLWCSAWCLTYSAAQKRSILLCVCVCLLWHNIHHWINKLINCDAYIASCVAVSPCYSWQNWKAILVKVEMAKYNIQWNDFAGFEWNQKQNISRIHCTQAAAVFGCICAHCLCTLNDWTVQCNEEQNMICAVRSVARFPHQPNIIISTIRHQRHSRTRTKMPSTRTIFPWLVSIQGNRNSKR